MLARATAVLGAYEAQMEEIDLSIPFTEGLRLGQRLRIAESNRPAWIGKIIGISARADGDTLTQVVTLERPVCTP